MKRLFLGFLILVFAVTTVASAAPKKKKKAPGARCVVENALRDGQTGSAPNGPGYGPDDNQPLDLIRAKRVTIRKGTSAVFTFSADRPDTENAVMLYEILPGGEYKQVGERGTAPHRQFAPLRYPEKPSRQDTVVIISSWAKREGMNGPWSPTNSRIERPAENVPTWIIGAEDSPNYNYRDMVVQVTCKG